MPNEKQNEREDLFRYVPAIDGLPKKTKPRWEMYVIAGIILIAVLVALIR